MFIAKIPNRNSPPTYLLRESYRENGKVKNRTLANLSPLPYQQIQLIRRVLKGDDLVPLDDAFRITRSLPHGHVQAVLDMVRRWLPIACEAFEDYAVLLGTEEIRELISGEIDRVNKTAPSYEQVRGFDILPDAFTLENGMLTPTLKPRRGRISMIHEELIERLYARVEGQQVSRGGSA